MERKRRKNSRITDAKRNIITSLIQEYDWIVLCRVLNLIINIFYFLYSLNFLYSRGLRSPRFSCNLSSV